MSLFISDLGFSDGDLVDAAKLGILVASLIVWVVGYSILRGSSSPQ
jgi:Na+/H+ antiporter NhaA